MILEKLIHLFDDHGKKIIYSSMALLLFAIIATPLFGAMEAHGWNV